MIKTIVAVMPVGNDPVAPIPFTYGLSLAAAHGAHLTLVAFAPKIQVQSGMMISRVRGMITEVNAERALAAQDMLAQFGTLPGVSTQTVLVHEDYVTSIRQTLQLSRACDLVLTMPASGFLLDAQDLLEELLFHTGRPLLLTPASWNKAASLERVVVGWDSGAQAARAVGDALPLIAAAGHVDIACVSNDGSKRIQGADLARHLSRHCASVSVVDLPPADEGVGAALRNHAALTRSDLMVMGAYGHSRLREFILGGATRDMLEQAALPTLLSH